jgi:tetratricopeptide (TPR) repeat protein
MSLRVFLSHASVDKPFVEQVKGFLETGGDIECWLDKYEIDFGQNVVARINDGLGKSDFLLLFLSPASLQSRWVEQEWTAIYYSQTNTGQPRLLPVLHGDCQPPFILQQNKYFDLRTNQLEGMRQIKAHLLREKPPSINVSYSGASLPNFIGREAELEELKVRLSQPGALVPIVGMPGLGKTYLARQFIRLHAPLFETVYELDCQSKDLAALTGELNQQLSLGLKGEAEQVAAGLRQYLSTKRCLLLLDNVEDDRPGELVPGGRAAVLVTTRSGSIPFLAEYPELTPSLFTDEEALQLFRRVLGSFPESSARDLFRKLGYLPMAISVAAGLIKHDLRYSVESLAASLPPLEKLAHGRNNVGRLLHEAMAALNEPECHLLVALAACSPAGARIEFVAEVAEQSLPDASNALQGLYYRSLVLVMNRQQGQYRLHPLIREATASLGEAHSRHSQCVLRRLENWERDPLGCTEMIEEAQQALGIAANDAWTNASVAIKAGNLSRALGRLAEALEFYRYVQESANAADNKSWLQVSYGNQALILQAWGRLEEAMALLQQEEAICRELGDRAGLQRSYGNQALILKAWGRLEEAMALLQKKEAICLELGNRASLAYCYWNWGLLLRTQGNHTASKEKLNAALSIFSELNMPRERDAVRQALAE